MTNAILDITEMVRAELKGIKLELSDFVFDTKTESFEFSFAYDGELYILSLSTDLDMISDDMTDTEKQKQVKWFLNDIKSKYMGWVFADG